MAAPPPEVPSGGSGSGTCSPLDALVADECLACLWTAAHRRLEAASGDPSGAAVQLSGLSDDERAAVDRMLGMRSRGRSVRVPLDRLDALLRARVGASLVDVVSTVVGPVRDRPGERAARADASAALLEELAGHHALSHHPGLDTWLDGLWATGSWRRLDDPGKRLRAVLAVLDRLPVASPQGRSHLAAEVLGDAHGLDDATPTGRLTVSALAHMDGRTGPLRGAIRRALWSAQGVIPDETSSTVLTLGLRPRPVGPLTTAAGLWAAGHVPLPIPLAAVQAETWTLPPGGTVWVCENPSVVAAARYLDMPIVCLEGRPSLAATLLLRSLVDGGVQLRYHGDFGAGGIAIANDVIGALGARPWRFCVEDHRAAVERAAATEVAPRPLRGRVPDACWDRDLAAAIERSGVEIEEELVLDLLVGDLRRASGASGR